jgi:hypothetical protein
VFRDGAGQEASPLADAFVSRILEPQANVGRGLEHAIGFEHARAMLHVIPHHGHQIVTPFPPHTNEVPPELLEYIDGPQLFGIEEKADRLRYRRESFAFFDLHGPSAQRWMKNSVGLFEV